MSNENHLERAGADLRGAVAAMSAPTFRAGAHRSGAVLAFLAGVAAVVAFIAIPLYLTRTPGPLDSPVGAAASSSTTSTVSPTESSTTTVPESTSSFVCGDELPFTVALPDDFDGPIEGPSPESGESAEDGQLAIHWLGRGGSVEIRWPANHEYLERAEWGSDPVWGGPGTDLAVFFAVAPAEDDRPAEIMGSELLPTDLMTGPCDAIQAVAYGPGHDGVLGRRGVADVETTDDQMLTIYPDLLRPRDTQLILDTVLTDDVPQVVACTAANGMVENMTGTAPDNTVYDTAVDALEAILDTDIAERWPKTGFFELAHSDGSVTYVNPVDDQSFNPQPQNGAVVSITVEETDRGWAVTGWESQSDAC